MNVGGINHFGFLHPTEVSGDIVPLQTSNPLHMGVPKAQAQKAAGAISDVHGRTSVGRATDGGSLTDFTKLLTDALQGVNQDQIHSDHLTQKLVTDPKSVDAHTVMIAAEKARISLTLTKTVVDQAIRGYRELINLR